MVADGEIFHHALNSMYAFEIDETEGAAAVSLRPGRAASIHRFTVRHPIRPYDDAAFPHSTPQRRTEDFTWR